MSFYIINYYIFYIYLIIYFIYCYSVAILATNVEDVREVLNYYRQFDNPLQVFRENQRKFLVRIILYVYIWMYILTIKLIINIILLNLILIIYKIYLDANRRRGK